MFIILISKCAGIVASSEYDLDWYFEVSEKDPGPMAAKRDGNHLLEASFLSAHWIV